MGKKKEKKKKVRDLCPLKEAGPVRKRPARDASLYNAHPLLRDLHHAHTADVHRWIRSVRLCVLLHVLNSMCSLHNGCRGMPVVAGKCLYCVKKLFNT